LIDERSAQDAPFRFARTCFGVSDRSCYCERNKSIGWPAVVLGRVTTARRIPRGRFLGTSVASEGVESSRPWSSVGKRPRFGFGNSAASKVERTSKRRAHSPKRQVQTSLLLRGRLNRLELLRASSGRGSASRRWRGRTFPEQRPAASRRRGGARNHPNAWGPAGPRDRSRSISAIR